MKHIYLDFEFRNTSNRDMDLVCVAWHNEVTDNKKHLWLYEDDNIQRQFAKACHDKMKEGYRFIGYSEAEARCLIQLWEKYGFPYTFEDFKYIDLMIEYRMLLNHDAKFMYGKQYIKGKFIETKPKPLYVVEDEDNQDHHHLPEYGLAAACYKMLDVTIDTEHKTDTVRLILDNETYTEEEKAQILEYCLSDIHYLKSLWMAVTDVLIKKQKDEVKIAKQILLRGEYSARTAKMVRTGYFINERPLRQFSELVPDIIKSASEDVNEAYEMPFKPFQWNRKENRYTKKELPIREWIEAQDIPHWPKTTTGRLSLSSKAFEKFFSSVTPGFGGVFVRYLKTLQSLNGFLPKPPGSKRKSFWDYLGDDGRIRPHFNIYGSQSARSQPAATGFLPLKSHWLRAFIIPPKGKALCTIDYGSEEFLLAGLISEDMAMIKAYLSGDPYLAFAKLAGAVPHDATKKTHKAERDLFKSTVLGIGYHMGAEALAYKITQDTGVKCTQAKAELLVRQYQEAFPRYAEWAQDTVRKYKSKKSFAKLALPCGWHMWGNNPNWRSVANFPIQGFGSSIMRKAVALAQDAGLSVIYTLHDALTIEYDIEDEEAIDKLCRAMDEGFKFYIKNRLKKYATCRLDVFAWSPEFENETTQTKGGKTYTKGQIYLDDRGEDDYVKYMKLLAKS